MATPGQLDKGAERVVSREVNRGSRARRSQRVGAKERIGTSERDVASEGLVERDDRKRAGKEPRSCGCGGNGDRRYQNRGS